MRLPFLWSLPPPLLLQRELSSYISSRNLELPWIVLIYFFLLFLPFPNFPLLGRRQFD